MCMEHLGGGLDTLHQEAVVVVGAPLHADGSAAGRNLKSLATTVAADVLHDTLRSVENPIVERVAGVSA